MHECSCLRTHTMETFPVWGTTARVQVDMEGGAQKASPTKPTTTMSHRLESSSAQGNLCG